LDFAAFGYGAAKKLAGFGHERVACVTGGDARASADFVRGFSRLMFERRIFFDEKKSVVAAAELGAGIFSLGYSGFACDGEDAAEELCFLARRCSLRIPGDLSVVALSYGERPPRCEVSWIRVPMRAYGARLCEYLVGKIEKTPATAADNRALTAEAPDDSGVDVPYDSRRKNIIVVGSVNVDLLINVEGLPQVGQTMNVNAVSEIPGGKGLNQAVGATRLGANVSLIARVGRDAAGANISGLIAENRIDAQGVTVDDSRATGKAFIYIPPDGDSSIIVYPGANYALSEDDITRNEQLFRNASYCLLPMEVPAETVEFAAKAACRHGVTTILKPSALKEISSSLLGLVDIFVPNEKEAAALCPRGGSIEDMALYFMERGAGRVIITMGSRGCYLRDETRSNFFPAAPFPAVDTTGGADAFISALAVCLNEKMDIGDAIARANVAAGFCVSRQGVIPAMVDRTTLELRFSGR
jgi:ribokinase